MRPAPGSCVTWSRFRMSGCRRSSAARWSSSKRAPAFASSSRKCSEERTCRRRSAEGVVKALPIRLKGLSSKRTSVGRRRPALGPTGLRYWRWSGRRRPSYAQRSRSPLRGKSPPLRVVPTFGLPSWRTESARVGARAPLLLRVSIGHNRAVAVYQVLTLPMQTSYLTGRLRSFGHAFRGLKVLVQTQHNARIHAVATILVVAAGVLARISPTEWALIALAVVCVWATEALNTSIEFLVDLLSPELHPLRSEEHT